MRGLALEGGGAKGAYHIGVAKALFENGYGFDGYVGTSIGAVNAALLAQGDFEKALELWENISMDQIFDDDEQQLGLKGLSRIFGEGGVSTEKMKAFFERYIDEEKLRGSGKDFGLVTMSVSERKPYELMLEDIPRGQLISYIMASAAFPGFKPETIDEKLFVDGGVYNNCPVSLLDAKGYDEIIAVRTNAPGILRKIKDMSKVRVVSPRTDLGYLMLFTPEGSAANIKLGYCDGLRLVHGLRGMAYYIEPVDAAAFNARLMALDDAVAEGAAKAMGIAEIPARRALFEKIVPQLGSWLKLEKGFDYADFALALLEREAERRKIDPLRVYGYGELRALVNGTPPPQKETNLLEELIPAIKDKKRETADILSAELLR
jgi:NTE family protein